MSWWRRTKEIESKALGINERNLKWIYPLNERKYFELADHKVLTKKILEENDLPVARTLGVIKSIGEIEEDFSRIPFQACAIKPARGKGGGGIMILDTSKDGKWIKSGEEISEDRIRRHIANIVFGVFSFGSDDEALIEEKIVPHPLFLKLFPKGVADLRLIVTNSRIVMAMLRIPTEESDGKANLHQGAIGVGVDLESGELTQGFNGDGYLDHHPDSGVAFAGNTIPEWEKVKQIALDVFEVFPLGYLGVDIAFDENKGPLILEINVRPGLEIQNVNHKGLKEVFGR